MVIKLQFETAFYHSIGLNNSESSWKSSFNFGIKNNSSIWYQTSNNNNNNINNNNNNSNNNNHGSRLETQQQ